MPPRKRTRRTTFDILREVGYGGRESSQSTSSRPRPRPRPMTSQPTDDTIESAVMRRQQYLRDLQREKIAEQAGAGSPEYFAEFAGPVPGSPGLASKVAALKKYRAEKDTPELVQIKKKKESGKELTDDEKSKLEIEQTEEAKLKGRLAGKAKQAAEDVETEAELRTKKIASVLMEHRTKPQLKKILGQIKPENFDTEQQFKQAVAAAEMTQQEEGASDYQVLQRKMSELDASPEDIRRAQLYLQKQEDQAKKAELEVWKANEKERIKDLYKRMAEARKTDIKNTTSLLRIQASQAPEMRLDTTEEQNQFIGSALGIDPQELELGTKELTQEQKIGVVNFFDEMGKTLTKRNEAALTRAENEKAKQREQQLKAQYPFKNYGSAGNLYMDLIKRKGADNAFDTINELAPLLGIPTIDRDNPTDFGFGSGGKYTGNINIKDINRLFEVKLPGISNATATQADPNTPRYTNINDQINSMGAYTQ